MSHYVADVALLVHALETHKEVEHVPSFGVVPQPLSTLQLAQTKLVCHEFCGFELESRPLFAVESPAH